MNTNLMNFFDVGHDFKFKVSNATISNLYILSSDKVEFQLFFQQEIT
jgi:hypothetical protein